MTGVYVIVGLVVFISTVIGIAWWIGRRDGKAREGLDAAKKGIEHATDANAVRADVRRLDDASLDAELRGRRK